MYTVASFLGFASQDEILAIGAEMNALQDSVFTGPLPRGRGFSSEVCHGAGWAAHGRAIGEFLARFKDPIARMVDRGVSAAIDIAVEPTDVQAARVLVGLVLSPALSSALGSAKVALLISVYRGEEVEALEQRDPSGGGAPDDSAPDLLPSQTEIAAIGALAPSELDEIDRALVAAAGPRNRKLAMVVATVLQQFAARFPALPDVFYAQRVIRLVKLGQLEGYGDLGRMRWSEVRLPRPS
jgi:hypothetical protein